MIKVFKYISLFSFIGSLVIHLLTFFPNIEISMGRVFYMHLIVLITFASMLFSYKKFRNSEEGNNTIFNRLDSSLKTIKAIPIPFVLIGGFFLIYASINFQLFWGSMEGGSPTFDNGSYYLHNHGTKIRDLTEYEYLRFQAYEVRGFSGHWMIFSLIPTIFYFNIARIRNATRRKKQME